MYSKKRVMSLILCLFLIVGNLGLSGITTVTFAQAEEADDATVVLSEEPKASNDLVDESEENSDDASNAEVISGASDQETADIDSNESVGSFVIQKDNQSEDTQEAIDPDCTNGTANSESENQEAHDSKETEGNKEADDNKEAEGDKGAHDSEEAEDNKEADDSQEPEDGKEADDSQEPEEIKELNEETETQNVVVDGVKITVTAEAGTFTKGWKLVASKAPDMVQGEAEAAIGDVRSAEENVAKSYTFDISILDADEKEIQPEEGKSVKVSFSAPENSDTNVSASVYHMKENGEAESLEIIDDGSEATVETQGFSYYTVEFTYGEKQYIMQGNSVVEMDEILEAVGLKGEVTNLETEKNAPFSIYQEEGQWFVETTKAFTTTHILKVTVKEMVFDIKLGYKELERTLDLVVTDDIPTTRTITLTKVWENDNESIRPSDVEVHLDKTSSTLIPGADLSAKMKILSGSGSTARGDNKTITGIRKATETEYSLVSSSLTSTNEVQSSGEKTYIWFDSGIIYYYSEADNIYLNADSRSTFSSMLNLVDISGLAGFNTTYVTNMAFMLENCVSLVDLSPLASWDVGNVTTMRFMLGASVTDITNDHMTFSDLSPLSGWNTQNVTDMGYMFKGAQAITSLEPLANWNMSNVANVNQMFMRAYSLTDATPIKDWNLVRVGQSYYSYGGNSMATGSFTQMFARAGDPTGQKCLTTLPVFTYRPGKWGTSNGEYTASTSPATGSAATTTKTQDTVTEYVAGSTGTNWTKNGNTWTATFTTSNDGSIWRVWEDTNSGYLDDAKGVTNAYVESSEGVEGYGSSSLNPITGVTGDATITNTNIARRVLTATINWDDNNNSNGDRPVFNNTTGSMGLNLTLTYGGQSQTSNSDVTKWVDNGNNTWTYTFEVYTSTNLSDFTITQSTLSEYSQVGTPSITVTSASGAATQTGTVSFTNRRNTAIITYHDLIIGNNVSGNQASRDKYFKVEVTLHAGEVHNPTVDLSGADATIPAYPNEATTVITSAVTQPTSITRKLLSDVTATFYLKSGQYIIIDNLGNGQKYTVTITSEDYEPQVEVSGADTDITTTDGTTVADTRTGISANTTITFTNTRHGVIPSGTPIEKTDGVIVPIVAIIGLLAIALKKKLGGTP